MTKTVAPTTTITLAEIQGQLKVPKTQFNSFGKYAYRSAEDILEAAKPIITRHGFSVTLTDEVVLIGQRYYVRSTATLTNGSLTYSSTAYAREEETKKGMDGSQVTGAASSYARKYALNGLFATDDTKDSDSTNTHGAAENPVSSKRDTVRKLCEKYARSERAKNEPLAAITFDALKKHSLKDLSSLKECNNPAVFDDLIDVLEDALAS